jgi:glycosyltransferase involved in cell wall biosynthesis
MAKVSIILPSRNEPYLKNTIDDLLAKAKGEIEIIAILDGWWEDADKFSEDSRVSYIHFSESRGMRAGINAGASMARGEYLLKLDAHCMVGEGYDEILKANMKENWVVVPRRYPLDPENWKIEERTDNKYPLDYMYLSRDLHGVVWKERDLARKDIMLDDTMSNQGSCWFMSKKYFEWLELMDEITYGTFWNEFQEIGLKCWLSGGEVKVNKNTWYAHWHKPGSFGRGYKLPEGEKERTQAMVDKWMSLKMFSKQIHDIKWLVDKFAPVPTWKI